MTSERVKEIMALEPAKKVFPHRGNCHCANCMAAFEEHCRNMEGRKRSHQGEST